MSVGSAWSVRVLVVEDHPAIGRGLAMLLAGDRRVVVTGLATSVGQARRLVEEDKPDVVLCDVMIGGTDAGFELLRHRPRGTRFLMYSAYDLPGFHAQAVRLGASGYLSKTADLDTILGAIRGVARGAAWFPRSVLVDARTAPRRPTPRELRVLELVVDGRSNAQTAASLGIAVKTVEGTLRRLFDRYDLQNRTALARLSERQGWVRTPAGPVASTSPR